MTPAVVQTLWARTLVRALADAGVRVVALAPGSRSTPLAFALAGEPRLEVVPIIDERAAAFYALGAARARPACPRRWRARAAPPPRTSCRRSSRPRSPGVPLIAVTADRPPELHDCGANQTIAQVGLYGAFPRGAFDLLGAPEPKPARVPRALQRKVAHAVPRWRAGRAPDRCTSRVPLRKPLEPAEPASDDEHAFARVVAGDHATLALPPAAIADPTAIAALAGAISAEPRGVIVAGPMPVGFARARAAVLALAARTGYPIVAEAGSQLRFGPRRAGVVVRRAPGDPARGQAGAGAAPRDPARRRAGRGRMDDAAR